MPPQQQISSRMAAFPSPQQANVLLLRAGCDPLFQRSTLRKKRHRQAFAALLPEPALLLEAFYRFLHSISGGSCGPHFGCRCCCAVGPHWCQSKTENSTNKADNSTSTTTQHLQKWRQAQPTAVTSPRVRGRALLFDVSSVFTFCTLERSSHDVTGLP